MNQSRQLSLFGGYQEKKRLPENNALGVFSTLGSRNYANSPRESNDFYATDPVAIDYLMQIEKFQKNILEPCCGMGHMSEALKKYGHDVESFDLIDRGYGQTGNFLTLQETDRDIITNPPYGNIAMFIRKGITLLKKEGQKLALFMRLLTLESKTRKILFENHPPLRVWVSSARIQCAKNGMFDYYKGSTAQTYAWFVWQAGHRGETVLKWF